jgi:hypothetical protein
MGGGKERIEAGDKHLAKFTEQAAERVSLAAEVMRDYEHRMAIQGAAARAEAAADRVEAAAAQVCGRTVWPSRRLPTGAEAAASAASDAGPSTVNNYINTMNVYNEAPVAKRCKGGKLEGWLRGGDGRDGGTAAGAAPGAAPSEANWMGLLSALGRGLAPRRAAQRLACVY